MSGGKTIRHVVSCWANAPISNPVLKSSTLKSQIQMASISGDDHRENAEALGEKEYSIPRKEQRRVVKMS